MKYICLGFLDEESWNQLSEREQNSFMDECIAYDDELREKGYMGGGEALESAHDATTIRYRNGKVSITDGPYAETKEQLGGFFMLEARDLNEAIRLVSNHPGLRAGGFEIRPIADFTEIVRASRERRAAAAH